jgi:hypothetical protein
LDVVMHMDRINGDDKDIAFNLSFKKARTRTPENRHYFEKTAITLADDEWKSSAPAATEKKAKPSPVGEKYHSVLLNALIEGGKPVEKIDGKPSAVALDMWKVYLEQAGLLEKPEDGDGKAADRYRASFSKYKNELLGAGWIAIDGDLVWSARRTPS